MQLNMGLGSGFAMAAWPDTAGTNANASPQGPATAAEAGFGTTAAGGGGAISAETAGTLMAGTLALAVLFALWWALPR
jgi:hypothetical protein